MRFGLETLIDAELTAYAEESRQHNAARPAASGPADFDELRQARDRQADSQTPSSARAVERLAEAGGRSVPVRIIAPRATTLRGAHLDIHAGGFYMGSAAGDDMRNERLADALGAVVVSVDYRLAPEHPWPAAPDDCETAARWLVEQAETVFGTSNLTLGGASAGANLAMATLLRLRDSGLVNRFAGAALQFGAYDLSGQTPGGRLYADEYFIPAYVGHVTDRTNPDISPLFGDLRDLPPTLLVVGASDILLEDNLALAARLCAAGNDLDVRVYPESVHGFTSSPTTMAAKAIEHVGAWLTKRLSQD
ncbi:MULTISPECIES: alpha/beta hydrolase [unclassified Nocardia]|uniref:alpha/beta hydrolase n=3 Tax=Nocardia TaxID=1817 RepID=UPI00278C3DED|nr:MULTISPECIES: alpha/beta hydrolase [unclassified Nocardia]